MQRDGKRKWGLTLYFSVQVCPDHGFKMTGLETIVEGVRFLRPRFRTQNRKKNICWGKQQKKNFIFTGKESVFSEGLSIKYVGLKTGVDISVKR